MFHIQIITYFTSLYVVRLCASSPSKLPHLVEELKFLIEKTQHARVSLYGKNILDNKEAWNNYYECLEKQWEVVKHFRLLPPRSVAVIEGRTVKLNCTICVSPSFLGTTPSWYWFDVLLPPDDWTIVDRANGHLTMYGVRREEAGQYECRLGRARSMPYFVHVLSSSSEIRLVKGRNSPKGPKPMPESVISAKDDGLPELILFTDWSPWSQCSRCGEVGLRYRFGACAVRISNRVETLTDVHSIVTTYLPYSDFTNVHTSNKSVRRKKKHFSARKRRRRRQEKITYRIDENTTSPIVYLESTTIKPKKNKKSTTTKTTDDSDSKFLLELFYNGLPCRSSLLQQQIRHSSIVKSRKNEIMEAYCKPPCVDELFEVKDIFGNVLERANNSAGVFSVLQGPPPVPPLPSRSTLFAPVLEPLTVGCPGHLHMDMPFYWTVNRKERLIPAVLANATNGRVTINFKQEIVFKEVEPEDGMLYVCWQMDSIAGVVRLVPFDPSAVKIDHHLIMVSTTLILGTFVYLFARIYYNRKRAAIVD